jgi:hypothetical protein
MIVDTTQPVSFLGVLKLVVLEPDRSSKRGGVMSDRALFIELRIILKLLPMLFKKTSWDRLLFSTGHVSCWAAEFKVLGHLALSLTSYYIEDLGFDIRHSFISLKCDWSIHLSTISNGHILKI